MKIQFERTGGFMGLRLAVDLDLDDLPPDDAETLRKLVEAADIFHLTQQPETHAMRDGFQYSINVDYDHEQHSTLVTDSTLSETLRPLVNELVLRARSNRP
ncbi:MAG: hypothetical protein NTW32_16135 [Chloroflexi bacterium]|nr:hypothetical protein [Chloroflexota bacterium]